MQSINKEVITYLSKKVKRLDSLIQAIDMDIAYQNYELLSVDKDFVVNSTPKHLASLVRRIWKIPSYPIKNLTPYLEHAGIFIINCNQSKVGNQSLVTCFDIPQINPNHTRLIFIVDNGFNNLSYRWNTAKQLGYMLFYCQLSKNDFLANDTELDNLLSEFALYLLSGEEGVKKLKRQRTSKGWYDFQTQNLLSEFYQLKKTILASGDNSKLDNLLMEKVSEILKLKTIEIANDIGHQLKILTRAINKGVDKKSPSYKDYYVMCWNFRKKK